MALDSLASLSAGIGQTPMNSVVVDYLGSAYHVQLKSEWNNPTGSIKDRTAVGLLCAMDRDEPLRPDTVVVESTSGNLGIALARLLPKLGCRLLAVIDPKTPERTRAALVAAGAEIQLATEPDRHGEYLLTRTRIVARLCNANPSYRRPNQYGNPANPLVHQLTTGPEIATQGGAALDAVYVAVGTGGTLSGISAYVRKARRDVRVIAVDLELSPALSPGSSGRLMPGVGSGRPSSFLRSDSYDRAVRIREAEALAVCRIFAEDTGLRLGGSSACVVLACLRDLPTLRPRRHPVCVCPDGGETYADTLYNDDWLQTMEVLADVKEAIGGLRDAGLTFRWDG